MKLHTRRVITRSGAQARGYFNSLKSRALIPWESQLEKSALLVFEFDPSVIEISAHQTRTEIINGETIFDTYPDFRITLKDGIEETVEVKSDWQLRNAATKSRLDTVKRYLFGRGITYRVLSETEITKQPRLSNLEELVEIRRLDVCQRLIANFNITNALRNAVNKVHTLNDVYQIFDDERLPIKLLANGLLMSDWSCPLSPDLPVAVNMEMLSC